MTEADRRPVRFSERLCMWSVVPICVLMSIGFIVAHLLPPPGPAASDHKLYETYLAHPDTTRIGITLLSIGAVFILPFGIAMAARIRRIEGPGSPMAMLQLGAAAFVATATMIYLFLLFVLSYRQGRPPERDQAGQRHRLDPVHRHVAAGCAASGCRGRGGLRRPRPDASGALAALGGLGE